MPKVSEAIKKSWTTKIEFDPVSGEHFIRLPDELMEELGWGLGDVLTWSIDDDQRVILSKQSPEGMS